MDDSRDPAPPGGDGQDAKSHTLPKSRTRQPVVIHMGPAPIVVVDAPPEVPLSKTQRARDLLLRAQMADELRPTSLRLPYQLARTLFSHVGLSYEVMIPPTPDGERESAIAHVADALQQNPDLTGPELYARCIETRRWCWARPTVSSRSWRSILTDAHKLANVPTSAGGDRRSKRARRGD